MDYTVMSLTNPHTIRGRPTLKDVEWFRNASSHRFRRLKALITLGQLITSEVEIKSNLHELPGFLENQDRESGIENRELRIG